MFYNSYTLWRFVSFAELEEKGCSRNDLNAFLESHQFSAYNNVQYRKDGVEIRNTYLMSLLQQQYGIDIY